MVLDHGRGLSTRTNKPSMPTNHPSKCLKIMALPTARTTESQWIYSSPQPTALSVPYKQAVAETFQKLLSRRIRSMMEAKSLQSL